MIFFWGVTRRSYDLEVVLATPYHEILTYEAEKVGISKSVNIASIIRP
ncbi:hypothetical protein [Texcoconibacillus texcoconensis]|nr:hypothetical protein [Texcoconibacillus texcoconensis]